MASTMRPVRLLHLTSVPFALWAFLRGQIVYMRGKGLDVQALTSPGAYLRPFVEETGIPVYTVEMPRRITPIHDLLAIWRLIRQFRLLRPDIVHAHTPKAGLLGMIAASSCRVPVRVYHVHGFPFMTATGRRRLLLKMTERIACRCAHRVLCVSASMREVAVREHICPEEKIVVLCSGSISGVDASGHFNPARFSADWRGLTRRDLGIGISDPVIGFIGRIVRDKGIVELTAAWKEIVRLEANAHLVLVGPVEAEDPVPAETLASLLADPRVHVIGPVEDTAGYLAIMDLVVLPTYREGFPIVPLEAAAMARPIVATRVPGCVDAVEDGVTGTLIAPQDVAGLREAIMTYLADPAMRDRHGAAGRRRALRDFRPAAIWDAIYEEYRVLLRRDVPTAEREPGRDLMGWEHADD